MKKENESRQMYLKTILKLSEGGAKVRNVDIANALGYSKPSVTNAVKKLVNDGTVHIDASSGITLTDAGRSVAEKLMERSTILTRFLKNLGADDNVAKENACRLEHTITDEMFEIIRSKIIQ